MINYLIYLIIRFFGAIISLLSYKQISRLGRVLGSLTFFLHRPFRKKAMTSLAIAYGSRLDESERWGLAKRSFQNLMITSLEFFRLKRSKHRIEEIVELEKNPEVEELLHRGQGVIFLSAHQANWEIPFLVLTEKWKGLAIGRPINNPYLYRYVLSIREMHGGKIILPKEATRKGTQCLKEGGFLGIVGDQAYVESSYTYPLLGTRAYTAATPALLAYRTNSPLVVGSCKRIKGRYRVAGSAPIWPDRSKPLREEMPHMMDAAMRIIEKSIGESPEQWMWVHDRFKQPNLNYIKKQYRYSFILMILPQAYEEYLESVQTIQALYPNGYLTILMPRGARIPSSANSTCIEYLEEKDLLIRDWRFQLLFDFTNTKRVQKHYKKLGVFRVVHSPLKGTALSSHLQTTLTKR